MLSHAAVVIAGLAWVGALFGVALLDERRARVPARAAPIVYALALAVYCTSWTFYGTVTQALRWDTWIPPTFVGTIVLYVVGWRFLARLVELAREHNSTSIADLVATRFGRSTGLAALVTTVAVIGIVPYIALQLKAVATSYALLSAGAGPVAPPAWQDSAFWVALAMAAFAMAIGTRRASAAEHNQGLVLAIAFESVLKLAAMLVLGAFVWIVLGAPENTQARIAEPAAPGSYLALVGLGVVAMFTLPHQFHIAVMECTEARHVRTARWLFPAYLLAIALPIPIIAQAGDALLRGSEIPSDLYILGLPLTTGHAGFALFAFLGGLSAATGMVILAAITLSVMIGNHWVAPLLARARWIGGGEHAHPGMHEDLASHVVAQRRFAIALLLALAYGYSRVLGASDALGDIGALSFSMLAQLAPAVLAAVYRPNLPPRAVAGGIVAGVAVWLWLLSWPTLVSDAGALSVMLPPHNLLGLGFLDPVARGTLLSLAANVAVTSLLRHAVPQATIARESALGVARLRALASRFLAAPAIARAFQDAPRDGLADPVLEARVEHELAAVIGAASARLLLDAARRAGDAPLDAVAAIVGEASQALRFNQSLLEAALENMSQGISVVDRELKLVAWNQRYLELFDYPPGLVRVGTPVEALVRHNLAREQDSAASERDVGRRLAHMRAGTSYVTERALPDGNVIEIRGNAMPGGGFVATFTDVTAFRRTEDELKRSNETLEQRVEQRTAESEAARQDAEQANRAKSRFLAAISHDLLQPLNAAHLFTHALAQRLEHPQYREAVGSIDSALTSTESLLSGLLDISRLDSGGLQPSPAPLDLGELMGSLANEFRVLAGEHGVTLKVVTTRLWVMSDAQLLRRILQNFLSNAVRYTERGGVLIGCRRCGANVRIEVWDSGPGIAEGDRESIFEEFRRLDANTARHGLGLGLAIADRMSRLLGHAITLRSWPGWGSVFAVEVPVTLRRRAAVREVRSPAAMPGRRVLVVDNEPESLRAMRALLEGWGMSVELARTGDEAERAALSRAPELVILDYHLDGGETGPALWARSAALRILPAVVVTADHGVAVGEDIMAYGLPLLHKPVRPLALKSVLARLLAARGRSTASG